MFLPNTFVGFQNTQNFSIKKSPKPQTSTTKNKQKIIIFFHFKNPNHVAKSPSFGKDLASGNFAFDTPNFVSNEQEAVICYCKM